MLRLIDETEENLKRIEMFGREFSAPVLNEWRYVTRHVVTGITGEDDGEMVKAIGHLKRARFDSYDILLMCLIDRVHAIRERYANFASIVAKYVHDYSGWQVKLNNAVRLCRDFAGDPKRDQYYDEVRKTVVDLTSYIEALEATEFEWSEEIRKQVFANRLAIARIVGSFIVGAATVAGVLFAIFCR